jgi:hypothetical protein
MSLLMEWEADGMTILNKIQTNHLPGYPEDAQLLIINADDFWFLIFTSPVATDIMA